ncbi:hypothetical protein KAS08_04100 [Candidatus Pacearchaeota archaeon]|nr:hypothetical protein [Candidatus Pacearchaeota archaeon]
MGLKKYLEKEVSDNVNNLKRRLRKAEASLLEIETMSPSKSNYSIKIMSRWRGGSYFSNVGETDINIEYKGTLKSAIIEAEKEFKEVNHRSDIQADYFVRVHFEEDDYLIPEKYWSKFKQRNRSR